MSEYELLGLWSKARLHIILSQLGPIILLILTVWLLASGLASAGIATRLAAAGILLASGILGAVAQVSSANEAMSVADDLATSGASSAVARRIIASKPWANIVRFVSPGIFVLIFVAILWALFV
jgi:hypothetical protein